MNQNYNPNNATRALLFRLVAMGVVLYWLMQTVVAYFKGGPDAPSLTLLIVSIVVLGGGAALVGWLTWKTWKTEQALAQQMAEEANEAEAENALPEAEEE